MVTFLIDSWEIQLSTDLLTNMYYVLRKSISLANFIPWGFICVKEWNGIKIMLQEMYLYIPLFFIFDHMIRTNHAIAGPKIFFFFVRPSQMNYLQSASPVTFLRIHECLFHFLLISVVIILTLVMQFEPQALYMSCVIWKARNLKNRKRKQKQKKDSFWVQNFISFAQLQYNSFSLWE